MSIRRSILPVAVGLLTVFTMTGCRDSVDFFSVTSVSPTSWHADEATVMSVLLTQSGSSGANGDLGGCDLKAYATSSGGEVFVRLWNLPGSSDKGAPLKTTASYQPGQLIPGDYVMGAYCQVPQKSSSGSVSVIIIGHQKVTWSPQTSITNPASIGGGVATFTPSTQATTSGDGEISYSVSDPSSSGCKMVDSRTGTLAAGGDGVCRVTATAAQTAHFDAGSTTVTFTISGVGTGGGGSGGSAPTAPVASPDPSPSYSCPAGSHAVTVGDRTFCELDSPPVP